MAGFCSCDVNIKVFMTTIIQLKAKSHLITGIYFRTSCITSNFYYVIVMDTTLASFFFSIYYNSKDLLHSNQLVQLFERTLSGMGQSNHSRKEFFYMRVPKLCRIYKLPTIIFWMLKDIDELYFF